MSALCIAVFRRCQPGCAPSSGFRVDMVHVIKRGGAHVAPRRARLRSPWHARTTRIAHEVVLQAGMPSNLATCSESQASHT